MGLPPVQLDYVLLKGGMDQITPTLNLANGVARQAQNFECNISGGYSLISGYERFDGHSAPSYQSDQAHPFISVAAFTNTPTVGQTLTASGGASGVIAYISALTMVIVKSSGTWATGETVAVGATAIGTVDSVTVSPTNAKEKYQIKNAVADIYRADIAAVPGSGNVRGVVEFADTVYAFRNNAGGTAVDIYKSGATGWTQVALYKTVSFTTGGTGVPVDGNTLTKGGVTATIKRVVRTSGSWAAGTAVGKLIITTPAGGDFSAGVATAGSVNVTLDGIQTAITIAPSGNYEFQEYNFAGQAGTTRIYGCDGVNKLFEFDGDVYVPIATGAVTDTPTHLACHKHFLFAALGSSAMYSTAGLPYDWAAGAGEIATGATLTGLKVMSAGDNTSSLGIFSREKTTVLYGAGTDTFQLVAYDTSAGALPFTILNMGQTFAYDDSGLIAVQTSEQLGGFTSATFTNSISPYVMSRLNTATCAMVNRQKNQYRVFFNNGDGLYVTVVGGKLLGCMPVFFPDVVNCAYSGRTSTGTDVSYFGSDNGMVYQIDKGTSFDGVAMDYFLQLNYSTAKSPRTLKRFRKASIEVMAPYSAIAEFSVSYLLGYDSFEYNQSNAESISQYISDGRWDSFTWDDFFWDSSGTEPINVELNGTAENIALFFAGSSDYVPPFTINSILMHYSPRRMMR